MLYAFIYYNDLNQRFSQYQITHADKSGAYKKNS